MVPRPLGRTGLVVSPVGLGTVKIGRNAGVKYPQGFALPTEAEVEKLLGRALELGVTLFDTAPAYGSSEERLRGFVKAHRGEIVVATKCGEFFENGESRWDFSRAALEGQIAASLKRLGTDHVDVLLLHSDGRDEEILAQKDALAVLREAKASGKARAIGISAKTEAGIRRAIGLLDVVMAPFSQAKPELGPALQSAHDAGIGILAIKTVEQGKAADPNAAVSFVAGRPFVDALVLGTLNPWHLTAAVAALPS
ncbi:MAG: aldo/keto reductase [Planctomycetes bacterium]|nr:aldo/keto reductase [Planctomycetota bacterium]